MSKKNLINILLVLALVLVIYNSSIRTQHGDKGEWIKTHGDVVNRRNNPDRYCLKCHAKKLGQTKEKFCNSCHTKSGVPLIK